MSKALSNRLDRLEDKINSKKTRTIIYTGKKPDIQDPNVVFWYLGDGEGEDDEWFEASDLSHEEWLKILDK